MGTGCKGREHLLGPGSGKISSLRKFGKLFFFCIITNIYHYTHFYLEFFAHATNYFSLVESRPMGLKTTLIQSK